MWATRSSNGGDAPNGTGVGFKTWGNNVLRKRKLYTEPKPVRKRKDLGLGDIDRVKINSL